MIARLTHGRHISAQNSRLQSEEAKPHTLTTDSKAVAIMRKKGDDWQTILLQIFHTDN